jgi:putative peptide zinc metalloprotease protein
VAVTAGALAAVLGFLAFVPWPCHTYAPGMLQTPEGARIVAGDDGYVTQFLVESGQAVRRGDALVRLTSPELELRIAAAEARLRQSRSEEGAALERGGTSLLVARRRRAAAEAQLADLRQRHRDLTARAPVDGVWVSPRAGDMFGDLVARGTPLGQIIRPPAFEFVAVVAQADSARLFAFPDPPAEIRLTGQAGEVIPVDAVTLIPGKQSVLPTAALGWSAHGPVKVVATDPDGLKTAEPYFRAVARVSARATAAMLHGQTGTIRFTTGSEPLLSQGWRRFRQLLQQRYQL